MNTIFDSTQKCQCFECSKDAHLPPFLLDRFCSAIPSERRRLLLHMYYAKPFPKNKSWTNDWKSITQKDFVYQPDLWSTYFSEYSPDDQFLDYVCRKWCAENHNRTLSPNAYAAQTMPDLFNKPRKAIYAPPRKCEGTYGQDYVWKDDYRPHGPFPGWCLKGEPPKFEVCDRY